MQATLRNVYIEHTWYIHILGQTNDKLFPNFELVASGYFTDSLADF